MLCFLYSLLEDKDTDLLLARYHTHKAVWLKKMKMSAEMFIETHQHSTLKMHEEEIEYAKAQLDSSNVMMRIFAAFSLIAMTEYSDNISASFYEIINNDATDKLLDWSGVPYEARQTLLAFVGKMIAHELSTHNNQDFKHGL